MAVSGQDGISQAEIRSELERIVSSKVFARSERMKRFLTFAVEQSLSSNGTPVKEYTIALAVYDKPHSFDPRIDPIVRVEASRLRAKLREYYEDEGRNNPVTISMRKKGYSALYKKRKPKPLPDPAVSPAQEIASGSTKNSEAQHLYLKGRHYWNRRNPEAISEAAGCFKRAIAIDSEFALAYAGLADCYATQAWLEMDSPSRLWQAAEQTARKALSINESLAQAGATLACKQALHDWNWTAAETSFRNSIARDPRYATAATGTASSASLRSGV